MSELDSYEGLQLLHADLIALSESQLPNLDRLLTELEARIEEFRGLLDKSSRNEQSRKSLISGTGAESSIANVRLTVLV